MPDADYFLRAGDSGEVLRGVCRDADSNPVSVADAAVNFRMAPIQGGPAVVDADGSNDDDGSNEALTGHVSYQWQAGDTDTPGLYLAQWKLTYLDGTVETFPNAGYILIRITADVPVAA